MAANFRLHLDINDWADDREMNRREAVDLARQALRVGGDDPTILAQVSFILSFYGDDLAACNLLIERALELNPSSAYAWLCSGWIRLYAGHPDLAIVHFETSLRLNPRGRRGTHLAGIGTAHLLARRFEEAVAAFHASLQQLPSLAWTYSSLASCYAHMGRLDEAREIVERLRAITSVVIPNARFLRNPEHREVYLSGLRLAVGEAT